MKEELKTLRGTLGAESPTKIYIRLDKDACFAKSKGSIGCAEGSTREHEVAFGQSSGGSLHAECEKDMMGAMFFANRGTHADARPQPVRAVAQVHVPRLQLGLNQAAVELRSLH